MNHLFLVSLDLTNFYIMPLILEEDLLELHRQIEHHKETSSRFEEELEEVKDSQNTSKRIKIILLIIIAILAILLLLGGLLYFIKPAFLVNKAKLEQQGTKILSIEEYDQMVVSLEEEVAIKYAQEQEAKNSDDLGENQESSLGDKVIYAVQIGAFENKELQVYSESLIQFKEIYNEDFYKYSVGAFETLEEAQDFRKEVVRLGFEDAFIASYSDGVRLKIEEAY